MRVGDADFDHAVEVTLTVLKEAARRSRDDADALVTYKQLSDALRDVGLEVG